MSENADTIRQVTDASNAFMRGGPSNEAYAERFDPQLELLGRGKTSGLELGQFQQGGASVFRVRDGKVTRLVAYRDRDRAPADFGLEE